MNSMQSEVSSVSSSTAGSSATISRPELTSQPLAKGLPSLPFENESNRLASLLTLPLTLVLLRHGDSVASRRGTICCNPHTGQRESGLVSSGLRQVRNSIIEAKEAGVLGRDTLIITSPFLRTVESAQVAASLLGARTPVTDERARERDFGSLNGQCAEKYEDVWRQDLGGQLPTAYESTQAVMQRMTDLVLELCGKHAGARVLLVSHGDPLNILTCALGRHSASAHRQINPFSLGELRKVELAPPVGAIEVADTALRLVC